MIVSGKTVCARIIQQILIFVRAKPVLLFIRGYHTPYSYVCVCVIQSNEQECIICYSISELFYLLFIRSVFACGDLCVRKDPRSLSTCTLTYEINASR